MGLEALCRGAASAVLRRVRPRGLPDDQREPRQAGLHRRPCSARRGAGGLPPEPADVRPDPGRPAVRLRPQPARAAPRAPARPRTACSSGRRRARAGARASGPSRTHLAQVRVRTPYAVRAVITAIYPGTYDPVTNGHVDVISRAAQIFDRVVVGVVGNPHHKPPMFKVDERVALIKDALAGLVTNVEVDVFTELVVDFARRWDAKRDRQGAPRHLGLRVGVPDEPAQPRRSRPRSRPST